jgi:hypothetical protein
MQPRSLRIDKAWGTDLDLDNAVADRIGRARTLADPLPAAHQKPERNPMIERRRECRGGDNALIIRSGLGGAQRENVRAGA